MAGSWSNNGITSITIPTGATTGARIVIDGVTGDIQVYDVNGDLAAYIGPADGGAPIILSYEVGGFEWSGLWNGSCLVGMGDPVTDGTVLGKAGGLIEGGDGGLFLANTVTTAIPVNAAAYLQGGTATSGAPGTSGLPMITLAAGLPNNTIGPCDVLATSAVIRSDPSNLRDPATWQVVGSGGTAAAFNANWATSTSMGTLTPVQALQYRLDPLDNVVIDGCWVAGSTTPGAAVFTLPAGMRPKTAHSITITKNTAGTVTTTKGYISPAGNLNLNSQLGSSATAGATYMVDPTSIPLGNIA
jgi:hypothetical protein